MLENWLMPKLEEDSQDFIFQQDGAPPHFHNDVRWYLNEHIPQRWIGRTGRDDEALMKWPPRSPDMTPCDFFLWGFVKDSLCPTIASRSDGAARADQRSLCCRYKRLVDASMDGNGLSPRYLPCHEGRPY